MFARSVFVGTFGLCLGLSAGLAAPNPATDQQVRAVFDRIDSDRNGLLDAAELAKAFRGPRARPAPQQIFDDKGQLKPAFRNAGRKDPDLLFLWAADKNDDGAVSWPEFQAFEKGQLARRNQQQRQFARAQVNYVRGYNRSARNAARAVGRYERNAARAVRTYERYAVRAARNYQRNLNRSIGQYNEARASFLDSAQYRDMVQIYLSRIAAAQRANYQRYQQVFKHRAALAHAQQHFAQTVVRRQAEMAQAMMRRQAEMMRLRFRR